MKKILLMSIKTKYANQIFKGTKKYEYRRRSIKEGNLNKKIFIYSSEIDKKIVGYIIVDEILEGTSEYILKRTNNEGNIDIINYFKDCENCYALKIKEAVLLQKAISLKELKEKDSNFTVPQYYRYIKETEPLYKILKEENHI